MLPHYIIDGYNLIHAIPSLKKLLQHDAFQAREQLAFLVSRLTFKRKFRCTIVFDGVKPAGIKSPLSHSPVHIVFSSPLTADDKIKSLIEFSKSRTSLVIITSDREILNFAKACACETHTSNYFRQLLFEEEENSGVEKDQASLSKTQIDEWLRIFGEKK